VNSKGDEKRSVAGSPGRPGASGITEVSGLIGAERTFLDGLVSLTGATGIALLVPFGILLVGLPIALAVRGVLELFGWLFAVNIR
jgi:hypothetical protein